MKKIKLTTAHLFIILLFCGLMTIQIQSAPTLRTNGKIAFTSDRDGNAEIYLMNADGTGQTRLTNNSVSDDYPTWSPNGTKLAFVRQNGSTYSINLMNADGTNQMQLTTFTLSNTQSYPYERFGMSWSPDGAKIAFQDSTDIFTINTDGSNRTNLTNGQFVNYEPSWSPDGTKIAFARSLLSHGYYPNTYTMNADGGNVRQITNCVGYCEDRSPAWSPDGGRIALTDSSEENAGILAVNPDGTNPQYNTYGLKPKWSPDGTKIIFYDTEYSGIASQIWVMNRNGSGLAQLTNNSPNNFHPDWQPLVITVSNIEELYAAINNSANAGSQIVLAPGVYMLSVNDPNGVAHPNGGRLEFQENMSLQGVVGDRGAVVIDAMNLPASSYTTPITNTGAIRMGKGANAVEWLTVRNAVNGGGGIIIHLSSPGTAHSRIAHIVSTGNPRGIDVRNTGAAASGYVIEAEIVDNDIVNNVQGLGEGIRFVNIAGGNGGTISANLSGNQSHGNQTGMLIADNRSNNAHISVISSGDRFFNNASGTTILGGLSSSTSANGNAINFEAHGSYFTDNNGNTTVDKGGLVIIGGENISIPNGSSNNTVIAKLFGCRFSNNQIGDLIAVGARANPLSVGMPGTNNTVRIALHGIGSLTEFRADSIPATPGSGNSLIVSRQPIGKPDDFDGDGRDDLTVFRPSNRTWYIQPSNSSNFYGVQFGLSTDKLTPADYDGDGKTDIAVFRDGFWYWMGSSNNQFNAVQFGQAGDIPVPADYDGDGRAELAVFRSGVWYSLNLSNNQFQSTQFGLTSDKTVAADYDGDGKADIAVVRQSGGLSIWYILGSTQGFYGFQFGNDTDKLVPADYDGDGKTDQAVFRPSDGNWYVWQSSTNSLQTVSWGLASDAFVPADYDGDGKADIAVYRNGVWYIRQTSSGINYSYFGSGGDVPTNQVQ